MGGGLAMTKSQLSKLFITFSLNLALRCLVMIRAWHTGGVDGDRGQGLGLAGGVDGDRGQGLGLVSAGHCNYDCRPV